MYNGEIIYIGKTVSLKSRIDAHGKKGDNIHERYRDIINESDVYYLEFDSGLITDIIETCLISKYMPKCNVDKKVINFDKYGVHYDEPSSWLPYRIDGEIYYQSNQINKSGINMSKEELEKEINKYLNGKDSISSSEYEQLNQYINTICDDDKDINWYLKKLMIKRKFVYKSASQEYLYINCEEIEQYRKDLKKELRGLIGKKLYDDDRHVFRPIMEKYKSLFKVDEPEPTNPNTINILLDKFFDFYPYRVRIHRNTRNDMYKNKMYWTLEEWNE